MTSRKYMRGPVGDEPTQRFIDSQNATITRLMKSEASLKTEVRALKQQVQDLEAKCLAITADSRRTIDSLNGEIGSSQVAVRVATDRILELERQIVQLRQAQGLPSIPTPNETPPLPVPPVMQMQYPLPQFQPVPPMMQYPVPFPLPPGGMPVPFRPPMMSGTYGPVLAASPVIPRPIAAEDLLQMPEQIVIRQDGMKRALQVKVIDENDSDQDQTDDEDDHGHDSQEQEEEYDETGENGSDGVQEDPRQDETQPPPADNCAFESYAQGLAQSSNFTTPIDQPDIQSDSQAEVTDSAHQPSLTLEQRERERKRLEKKERLREQKLEKQALRKIEAEIRARDEAEALEKARMQQAQRATEKKAKAAARAEAEAKRKADQEADAKRKAEKAERRLQAAEKHRIDQEAKEAEIKAKRDAAWALHLAKFKAENDALAAKKAALAQQKKVDDANKAAAYGKETVRPENQEVQEGVEGALAMAKTIKDSISSQIGDVVNAITTGTKQDSTASHSNVFVVKYTTEPLGGSFENMDNMICLSRRCRIIFESAPTVKLTKPASKLQDNFLFLVSLEICTKAGPGVFSIRDTVCCQYSLYCNIEETMSDQIRSRPVDLETISFWFENDDLTQACFQCYPRLLAGLPSLKNSCFDSMREEIEEYFQTMRAEAPELCEALRMQVCETEQDALGLPKYTIRMRFDKLMGEERAVFQTRSHSQVTLVVWYLKGLLAYYV